MRTLVAKLLKVNGETFSTETEARLDAATDKCVVFLKIVGVITIWKLIFGESKLIDGAPLWWRIFHEWKHLLTDLIGHIHLF